MSGLPPDSGRRADLSPPNEADAVKARYARRRPAVDADRYHMLNPAVWQAVHERQRALIGLLRRQGLTDLSRLHLVEVGAGAGGNLLEFLRLGFDPAHLTAIELLPERAEMARRVLPQVTHVLCGDALEMPIEASSQDVVFQSVVFSSLLDDAFAQRMADAMWSWVRPGGGVLWYDFTYNNPANPDVRGVPLSRIRSLFPQAQVSAQRVTLAPPISRRVCRIHPAAYRVFNALPLLRTHLLCWLGKPESLRA